MVTAGFLGTTTRDDIQYECWIEIEGIRRRYGITIPSWAVGIADTGENRPIRPWFTELPQITGQEASPLDGTSTPQSFQVSILDVDDELTDLFSVNKAGNESTVAGSADIQAGSATFSTDDDMSSFWSVGDYLYMNKETMKISNIVGTALTVSRGLFGSLAQKHYVKDESGNPLQVIVSNRPRYMHTREIILYENRVGLVESDKIAIRGYIDDYSESNGVWTINCPGFMKRMLVMIGEDVPTATLRYNVWGGHAAVNGLPTWESQGTPINESNDQTGIGPTSTCTTWYLDLTKETEYDEFTANGAVAVSGEIIEYVAKEEIKSGTGAYDNFALKLLPDGITDVGYDNSAITTVGRGQLSKELYGADWVLANKAFNSIAGGNVTVVTIPKRMTSHKTGDQVRQVLGRASFTAGIDPISVFIQLMVSTGTGTNDDGATNYDSLPRGWGAEIPYTQLDIAGMELLRDKFYNYDLPNFYINGGVNLMEWVAESLLRINLLFPIETPDGKISLSRIFSNSEASRMTGLKTIDTDVLLRMPDFEPGPPPIGKIVINANHYPADDEYLLTYNVILGSALSTYRGLARNVEIDCPIMYDSVRSGEAHLTSANFLESNYILKRFLGPIYDRFAERPMPILTVEVPYNQVADMVVGDVVEVTCPDVVNPINGTRGLTNAFFQIVAAQPDPTSSSLELTLWQTGVHDKRYNRIAPAGKIVSYTGGGGVGGKDRIVIEENEFTTAATGDPFDEDIQGFAVGDEVQFVDANYVPANAGAYENIAINGVGPGGGTPSDHWIDLETTPAGPPAAGEYVVFAKYDDCSSDQQDEFAWMSGTDDTLGAAGDGGNVRL